MQHLILMARFILLEQADGPTELKDSQVVGLIENNAKGDGIGNESFETELVARKVLSNLDVLYEIFKDDAMLKNGGSIHELRREYIMISLYLLARYLRQYYVFGEKEKKLFKEFFLKFHERWQNPDDEDRDILSFSEHRQQDQKNVEARHCIIRQLFFQYTQEQNKQFVAKDEKRAFNEAERTAIYRRDKGLCQMCLAERKNEQEATVGWPEYEADHVIPHSKGGPTAVFNGQVLCRYHNAHKSDF